MLVKALVVVTLAIVFGPVLRTLWNMGWDLHFHKQHPGKCRVIKQSGIGSEDFQILSSGLTFITSGLAADVHAPKMSAYVKSFGKGSIQVLDLNLPNPEAKQLNFKPSKHFNPDTFRPHGLSVLEDKVKGEHLVYVINHAEGENDRVEKFKYSPKTNELHHVKSFLSDAYKITNDLTVVSEDKFYITKCSEATTNFLGMLEMLYQLPLGAILYHNGTGITTAQGGLVSPNGVVFSQNHRYLYVSLITNKLVNVYKVGLEGDLQLVQEVNVHTGVDNFQWSEDGQSLYAGCHPIMHKIASHLTDPADNHAPSQVIRLPLKDGLIVEEEITQEFYDQGKLISGSSTAGVYKDRLLVSSVIDTLVVCDLPKEP